MNFHIADKRPAVSQLLGKASTSKANVTAAGKICNSDDVEDPPQSRSKLLRYQV